MAHGWEQGTALNPGSMRTSSTLMTLSLTVLFPLCTAAQKLFDIGLKAGVNLDDLRSGYTHQAIVGAHAGVFARVKPPLLPGVQGELLLTSLGSDVRVEGYKAELRSMAVRVPLMLVWGVGPAEIHAGAYFDKYLTEDIVRDFEVPVEEVPVELADLEEDGYGLLFGGGLHLGQFYGGVRYNLGLTSIGSGPYLDDVKNRQWQVYIGLGFVNAD